MAYSSTLPPFVVASAPGDEWTLWAYVSTHTVAEAVASGFISNGDDLGMKVGDPVLVSQSTGYINVLCYVTGVTASSAATISSVTTSSA